MRILSAVVTMVVLGAVSGPVLGQSRSETAARECAAIADATQRLACYDSLFRGSAAGSKPAAAVTPAAATAAPAVAAAAPAAPAAAAATAASAASSAPAAGAPPTVDPLAEFGLTEQQKQRRQPKDTKPAPLEGFEAAVTAAEQDRNGMWRLTLDNGQVWVQAEAALGVRFQAGSQVEIRKGSLGSFLLKVPGRPVIRVRRVR